MSKFRIGKVRVRKDLELGETYFSEGEKEKYGKGCTFTRHMEQYLGKEVTITKVFTTANGVRYSIEEDKGFFYWCDEMFVSKKEKKKQDVVNLGNSIGNYGVYTEKVIYSGMTTILFYRSMKYDKNLKELGKSNLKKVVVKCLEGDEYNKEKGLNICILKAIKKETTRLLEKM